MEWLINRRRMMYNRAFAPEYISIDNVTVWTIACENFGDFNEIVITDNGNNTVNIVTTYKSMLGSVVKKEKIVSSQMGVDNTGGTYTPGTTLEPIGLTQRQSDAITDFTPFRDAGLLFDDYCDYFPQTTDEYGYVAEGITNHFDGINKGNNANAWTDLLTDIYFPLNEYCTSETNAVYLNGQGSTMASDAIDTTRSTKTFEICCNNINKAVGAIYNSGKKQQLSCLITISKNGMQYCLNPAGGYDGQNYYITTETDVLLMSLIPNGDATIRIINGVEITARLGYGSAYTISNTNPTIGGLPSDNLIECRIYSIRVYNRALSEDEVLHNQRVDNERFNMGLEF